MMEGTKIPTFINKKTTAIIDKSNNMQSLRAGKVRQAIKLGHMG